MRRFTVCLPENLYQYVVSQPVGRNEFLRQLADERMRTDSFRKMVEEMAKQRRGDHAEDDIPF